MKKTDQRRLTYMCRNNSVSEQAYKRPCLLHFDPVLISESTLITVIRFVLCPKQETRLLQTNIPQDAPST